MSISEKKCAIFLSFLAYQNEFDIELLNETHELWPAASHEWPPLWDEIKSLFVSDDNHNRKRTPIFKVFSCSDYGIGNTQFVYAVTLKQELIIAFRGTKTATDVLTDVRVDKDKCTDICYTPVYLKEKYATSAGSATHLLSPMVHSGFHEMYGLMKYALFEVVQKYKCDDDVQKMHITLTGHSLGGALSILALPCLYYGLNAFKYGFEFESSDKSITISNITFGSPKVGNHDFSLVYDRLIHSHSKQSTGCVEGDTPAIAPRVQMTALHYFHNSDPIPCMPVLSGFYCCQNAVQINKHTESRFYSVRYHLIECYLKHLLDCLNSVNL